MGQKLVAGDDLALRPLDDVLKMLVRETYARSTRENWKFPPDQFSNYKGDTPSLLKHLIREAFSAWGFYRYTLYDMESPRADVITDRSEFLKEVLQYDDVDLNTQSNAAYAVHEFIKKARYETNSYQADLLTWSVATRVDTSGDYDLMDAYKAIIKWTKKNWLKTTKIGDVEEEGDYPISAYIGAYDGMNHMGYTNFYEAYGSLTVSIPYRVRSIKNLRDWVACVKYQGQKQYIYKKKVTAEKDDSLGECIVCGIGSLAEGDKGAVKLDEEWENTSGLKLYGSGVLCPEYEEGLGGNLFPVYKHDRAKEIIANGGTVPGCAG